MFPRERAFFENFVFLMLRVKELDKFSQSLSLQEYRCVSDLKELRIPPPTALSSLLTSNRADPCI